MVFMQRLAPLALVTMLAFPVAVEAQTASPQTADADAPGESHIAAALDLLNATHANDILKAMLDALTPAETQTIKRAAPSLSDAMVATIEKQLSDTVISRQDELLRIQAIEYARHFDESELRDLAAFYRTPLGQKYILATPVILKESAPIVRQWMLSVVGQAQENILRSLPREQNEKP
jgi:hypothetical protein